jgi:hypothetical protein
VSRGPARHTGSPARDLMLGCCLGSPSRGAAMRHQTCSSAVSSRMPGSAVRAVDASVLATHSHLQTILEAAASYRRCQSLRHAVSHAACGSRGGPE